MIDCPVFKQFRDHQNAAEKKSDKGSSSHAESFFIDGIDSGKEVKFVIDSGTTEHMTPQKELFDSLEPINREIMSAGHSTLDVEGLGHLTLILERGNGETTDATLENMLYVPGLRRSLFSVSATNDHGYTVTFKKDR